MKMRSVVPMRIAKIGYIVISLAFCLFGIIMMIMPESSVNAIGTFFGISMIAFGIVKLVGYFSRDLFQLAFQFDLQFGILLMALGVIVLLGPENVITFLCIALGISALADGLFKIQIALDSKSFGIKTWWMIFSLAILTCITGLLLIFQPSTVAKVIVVLLGISLLSEGILNLCVAISTVKIIKNQLPDNISDDCELWENK